MLKRNSMVPGDRPKNIMGHKYNSWEVLYFVSTEDAGSTKAGITYLSKYPEPLDNVTIRLVALPLVMYKLFVYINDIESQKNPDSLV